MLNTFHELEQYIQNIIPYMEIIFYSKLKQNHFTINTVINICISGLAELVLPRKRDGRLRQNYAPTLYQGITKKCIGDSAFGAAAPRLWNELHVNIRASGTLSMFRKCLKTYRFIRHFN